MWTEVYELAELLKSGKSTWEDLDLDDVDVRLKVCERERERREFFFFEFFFDLLVSKTFSHLFFSLFFPPPPPFFLHRHSTSLQWIGLFHRRKRTPGKFMMRVRVPNGDLTAAQLRALGQAIAPYGDEVGCADVTTRAGIQLRGITLDDAGRVLDVLKAVGITPIQSGMDNVRQVSDGRERERQSFPSYLLLFVCFFSKPRDLFPSFFFLTLSSHPNSPSSLPPPSLNRSRAPPSQASTPWSSATRAPLPTRSTT